MTAKQTSTKLGGRGCPSLGLDPEVARAVDMVRLRRAGGIARNSWITEAIGEKFDGQQNIPSPRRKAGHGNV
jgi:hypothetical protein